MIFEYRENNSGGHWWLDKAQYDALEAAGWTLVEWPEQFIASYTEGGWTRPYKATGDFACEEDAIDSFECATGAWFDEPGCSCCGKPHELSEEW